MEQHEPKKQVLFRLGNATNLLDVTPSNLLPHPLLPPPFQPVLFKFKYFASKKMKSLSFYVSFNAGQKLTLLAYAGPTKLQCYHITQFFKSYYLVSSHSIWCARHSLFKCLSDVVQKEIFVLLSALVKAVFHEPLHSHGVLILCNELCTI